MLYIGIDGGGTKTKMALFDDAGRKLKEIIKPSVHVLTQPREICIQILKDGVMELDANFQAKVIAGLAGYGEQKEVRNKIATICREAFGNREFSLYSDVRIAITGALGGGDGIVVVAGTGSIALSSKNNHITRCGGWGYQLGDEGSAYWIAKRMLALYCQQVDGRLEKTQLYYLIKEKCKLENDYDIITFINKLNHDRTSIASLAKLNGIAAKDNDKYALQIYKEAAYEIAVLIKTLAKNFTSPFKVSYIGGVFEYGEDYVLKPLNNYLQPLSCQLVAPLYSLEYGAYLLGKK